MGCFRVTFLCFQFILHHDDFPPFKCLPCETIFKFSVYDKLNYTDCKSQGVLYGNRLLQCYLCRYYLWGVAEHYLAAVKYLHLVADLEVGKRYDLTTLAEELGGRGYVDQVRA